MPSQSGQLPLTNQQALEAVGRAIAGTGLFAQVVSGDTGDPITLTPSAWVYATDTKEQAWSGFSAEERIRVLHFDVLIEARPAEIAGQLLTVDLLINQALAAVNSRPLRDATGTVYPGSYGALSVLAETRFPRRATAARNVNPGTSQRFLAGTVAFDV